MRHGGWTWGNSPHMERTMADINEIDAQVAQDEEVVDIPIYQKNGEPYLAKDGSQSTIGVTGEDAKRYVTMQGTIQRRMIRQRRTPDDSDVQRNRVDQAAAGVGRWHGWEAGDQPFPYSPDNVKALLSKAHILKQVEAGIAGHADFFKSSAT